MKELGDGNVGVVFVDEKQDDLEIRRRGDKHLWRGERGAATSLEGGIKSETQSTHLKPPPAGYCCCGELSQTLAKGGPESGVHADGDRGGVGDRHWTTSRTYQGVL